MTKVIQFYKTGGPDVLQIEEFDIGRPGANEVKIKIKSIGLNRAEALLRQGKYAFPPIFPQRMGYEAAGIVDEVGTNVTGFTPGDRVSVIPSLSMVTWPSYGEAGNFPAHLVVKHPTNLSWEQAAAIWMQYITAYGALVDVAKITAADQVVITAASSSVGVAAIQICRALGARVIATSRTNIKKQALLNIGATHVISLEAGDYTTQIKKITGDNLPRVIFDPIGGPTIEQLCESLAPGGILIEYGNLSDEPTPFPASQAIPKGLSVRGFAYSEIVGDPERLATAKSFILEALSVGLLRPLIAKTFRFEQMIDAHHYLEKNNHLGKVVVKL